MSERLTQEVLERAWHAAYDAFSGELLNDLETPNHAVAVAAMRAVLEGHQQRHHAVCPQAWSCKCPEGWPQGAASDGLRHDSIKPTSGRLLSAKKVKKASEGSPR